MGSTALNAVCPSQNHQKSVLIAAVLLVTGLNYKIKYFQNNSKNSVQKVKNMPRIKDWTGQQINYWTILEPAPKDYARTHGLKDQHQFWKCQCICGHIDYLSSKHFSNKSIKSCGCMRANKKQLAGTTQGRISIISENYIFTQQKRTENPNNRDIYWNCHCNFCHNDFITSTSVLTLSGNNAHCPNCRAIKDIRGQKNGKLTVVNFIRKDDTHQQHDAIWSCQCECGNIIELPTSLIRKVYSCGCLKESIGEYNIKQVLNTNNIKYIYNQPYYKDLHSKKNYLCRYDFILLDQENNPFRIIEFDGKQHVDITADWYSLTQAENDKIKDKYARDHNIPLVRIPYYMRDKITLDIILGNKFLVQEEFQNESNISRTN